MKKPTRSRIWAELGRALVGAAASPKTLLMAQARFLNIASREGLRATDMESGAEESYDRLEALQKTP